MCYIHSDCAGSDSSPLAAATVNPQAGEDGQPALLANMLSKDHKPEDPTETTRVESLGKDTHTHIHTHAHIHTYCVYFLYPYMEFASIPNMLLA